MAPQFEIREAMESLYDSYANDVYRYARMTLGNAEEAYDVVQEVFLRAYRSWGTFRGESNVKTWLMTIARHYIIDVYRKKRAQETIFCNTELLDDIADESVPMHLAVMVQDVLGRLKVEYRQAVVLRYIENLSVSETASVLGWSETKVRNATHRGLQKLRKVFDESPKEVPHQDGL